jgi:outer membrane receptor for ferric coprogen and ferric-rhodotorulic acid
MLPLVRRLAATGLWFFIPPALHAQTAPASRTVAELTSDVVRLSPFEVRTDTDKGYAATSTLSGSRVATSLMETPAMIGVLTREFLDDIGAQNLSDFGNWATNTVVFGVEGNNNTRDRDLVQPLMRGAGAGATTRNYFGTSAPIDGFNIERLESARGPNALLFGDAPLGGVTTSNTKRALFGRSITAATVVLDSRGSRRGTLDFNRYAGPLAVRINGLVQRNKGWRDSEFYDRDSVHGAVSYRPWKNTTIRIDAEWGLTRRDAELYTWTESVSNWNGTTVASSPNVGAAGTGTSRLPATADYWVWDQTTPSLGLVNWQGTVQTTGSGLTILPPEYSPAEYRPGKLNFPQLPRRTYTLHPRTRMSSLNYYNDSLVIEQTVGKLAVELAANYESPKRYWFRERPNAYFLDLNSTLPTGAANPRYLKAFDDAQDAWQWNHTWTHAYRATLAYPFDFGFTQQRLVVMGTTTESETISKVYRAVRTNNPAVRNLQQSVNIINTRRYWDEGSATPLSRPVSGNGVDIDYHRYIVSGSASEGQALQAALVGGYFKNRLSTIIGIRSDSSESDNHGTYSTTNDWERNGIRATDYRPLLKGEASPKLLDPLGTAESVWFSRRMDLVDPNRPYDPVTNRRYSEIYPMKTRVSTFSAGTVFFPVKSFGLFANMSSGFNPPGGNTAKIDYSPTSPIENEGFDYGLKLELFGGKLSGTVSRYRSEQRGYSLNAGVTPYASIWNQAALGYQEAAAANPDQATALRAKSDAAFQAYQSIVTAISYFDYQETRANGYEVDLTARPLAGWSVMFNFAVPRAFATNRYKDTIAYHAKNSATAAAYAADEALTAARRTSIRNSINTINSTLLTAVDGFPVDQSPKYTANCFNSYRFSEGRLKGLRIGGGVQARGRFNTTAVRQVYGVNPANGLTQFYAPDPLDNIKAEGYNLYSLMLGYERRLGRQTWGFQLNVSNLLDEDKIIFTGTSGYTYSENGVTKGVQVPQTFRYLDPRKFTFTVSSRF